MRRGIILFIAAILFAQFATAQISEVVAPSDSVDYLTPQEYAMMLDRNDRFLIRADILSAGVEWEFAKRLSIFAQAGFIVRRFSDGAFSELAKAELRYYFPNKKVSQASLNGLYLSAGGELYTSFSSPAPFNTSLIYTNIGLQRRFLGNGLVDFGFRFGYQNEDFSDYRGGAFRSETSRQGYVFETTAAVGLGITFNKRQEIDYERLCPVLKCHDTERFLLKINVANVLRMVFVESAEFFNFEPSLAFEQKLGNYPLSVQLKASCGWGADYYNAELLSRYSLSTTRLILDFEGRYYYDLRSRISKGKTGNSLSANYFAVGYSEQNEWVNNSASEITRLYEHDGIFLKTGIQRTYGKNLYFDVYLGAGVFQFGTDKSHIDAIGEVECGFKF